MDCLCHFPGKRGKNITQTLRIMKVAIFILLSTSLSVSARSYSQDITLSGKNLSLAAVFEAIHAQAGYFFVYEPRLLKRTSAVTINVQKASVTEVLNSCLKDQGLSYEIKFNTIIVRAATDAGTGKPAPENNAATAPSPPRTIKGKVTDENGQPMAGVTVSIKGSQKAVTTDGNGEYTIGVPDEKATLQFSYVGFTTQEIAVGSSTVYNIRLGNDTKSLNQMIVVGYGTQKKKNITGAVATYSAKDIDTRPVTRVDQALVGQMAGVQVKQTTGVAGKGFSIQVRGSGSISAGNEPLYVIDGFPLAQASPNAAASFPAGNPLDNLNPDDIESIQVLKDASSAAIYGSRAANGVVLITTKQGKTGKPVIGVSAYTGYNAPSRKMDMLSPEEWIDRAIEMHNEAWVESGPGRTADQTSDERRQILGLAPGQVNSLLMSDDRWSQPGHPGLRLIDWQDAMFRKGPMGSIQASASGGNEFTKYYVSGSFLDQNGLIQGMNYRTYSARANIEITPNKRLRFGINLTPTWSMSNDPGSEGINNVVQTGILFTPVQEDSTGLYANSGKNGQYVWGTSANSPVARLQNNIGQTKIFRTLGSAFAEYKIWKGLAFKSSINLDYANTNNKNYIPYTVTGALTARLAQPGAGTTGSLLGFTKTTFVNENTLSYTKVIKEKHDISAVVGQSYNTDKLDNFSISSVGGYGSSVINTLNAASATSGLSMETKDVLISYFGRVQYAYDGKYLASVSLRRDGSSRFGANTKYGWFPSASLGWRLSQESFLQHVDWLTDLKLRASWGKSGNYNIGDYSSIPLLSFYNYTFNNALANGQAPAGVINPNLSWETSETKDIGFDASIFNNRIALAFDYYDKKNSNLLLNVPIPEATGFSSYLSNAGSVRNRGWELEVNTQNLVGKLQWSTSINISHNTNKVLALAGGQSQILIPSSYDISHSILQVGKPMYSIYVIRQLGILSKADISKGVAEFGNEQEGDPKYLDANGDGIIDANDRVIVGHPNPDYVGGITNTLRYKGFEFSFLIQGQVGGSIYSLLGRAVRRTGQDYTGNVLGIYRDRWRSEADPGNGIVPKAYSTFGRIVNTDWLYSSNYWRLRNITLGYNLARLQSMKFLKTARLYVTMENWFGKDKYYGGFNPEAANTDLSGSSTFPEAGDYGGLPLPKSLIVGLNLTF
jgi:TonB-linked SusC/RagA family outer membrane protein